MEIDGDLKPVWEYDGKGNGNAGKPVEVHAFQRLSDGGTMIVESGPAQIIEVTPDKRVVWTFKDFMTFGNSMPVAVVFDP